MREGGFFPFGLHGGKIECDNRLVHFHLRKRAPTVLFVALTLLISLNVFWDLSFLFRVVTVAFLFVTIVSRSWDLVPCALLFFFLYVGAYFFPSGVWHLPAGGFLAALLLTFLVLLPTNLFRSGFAWFRRGSLDQITLALVVITSLFAAVALGLWAMWTDYLGIGSSMIKSTRGTPTWLLLGVGVPGFALLNAFAEEAVYRGFLQEALRRRFPRQLLLVLALQASAFAAAHYFSGFPNGKMGYLMTFTYAMMLGYLRERAEGMLAPFLTHFTADVVIGILLFLLAY